MTRTKTTSNSNVKTITLTAMFAALVTVATAFIKVPTALGYCHAGDSMVYLAACILPGPYGIIASAIGGGFADLISGFPQWILPTVIIKALNAVPFVILRNFLIKKNKDNRIINAGSIMTLIPTSFVTVFGYFIANLLLFDLGGAVAELATWYVQPGLAAVVFIAVGLGLDAIKFKSNISRNF
ncbi:MAG: ECF transporter S component [Ruminococcus sp.]|nr:ECF transporter S component [Ruminococcus sp.]